MIHFNQQLRPQVPGPSQQSPSGPPLLLGLGCPPTRPALWINTCLPTHLSHSSETPAKCRCPTPKLQREPQILWCRGILWAGPPHVPMCLQPQRNLGRESEGGRSCVHHRLTAIFSVTTLYRLSWVLWSRTLESVRKINLSNSKENLSPPENLSPGG